MKIWQFVTLVLIREKKYLLLQCINKLILNDFTHLNNIKKKKKDTIFKKIFKEWGKQTCFDKTLKNIFTQCKKIIT